MTATTRPFAAPALETLEGRDAPATLAAQLQYRKYEECQVASSLVQQAYQATKNYNGTLARNDLRLAQAALVDAAKVVVAQVYAGYESKSLAQKELNVLSSAYDQVSRDLRIVDSVFTTHGPLGNLLSWNGQYLGGMSNYFRAGA